jgi:hypothetical protein
MVVLQCKLTLRGVEEKCLECFLNVVLEKDGDSWTDRVKSEVKGERNILRTVTRKKANRIGRILCRKCLLNRLRKGRRDLKVRQ